MTSLAAKLVAATVAAGVTALMLAPLVPRDGPRAIDLVFAAETRPEGEPDDVAPPATGLVGPGSRLSALDLAALEGPVDFPPSTFVRGGGGHDPLANRSGRAVADRFSSYRHRSGIDQNRRWAEHPDGSWKMRTNSLGLRENDELLEGQVHLRMLVTGDSHTDGVCDNEDAFGNLVEARLRERRPGQRIESLNAGLGGYTFYNYLGVLERFLALGLAPDVFVVGVYGGNDFENVLTRFHVSNGTRRPPGRTRYPEEINEVMRHEDLQPLLAQSFMSYKYFEANPGEMETALQAARDVTTEIVVTCMRNSVHPIFVYIPPMSDTEWDQDAERFERITRILELGPQGLSSTRRMADSYVEFLRQLRVDVIDLREVFAEAGPGNYWLFDNHINLRAQELIARELLPLVEAACPADVRRLRPAPVSRGPLDPAALLSSGCGLEQTDWGGDDVGDLAQAHGDDVEVDVVEAGQPEVRDVPRTPR